MSIQRLLKLAMYSTNIFNVTVEKIFEFADD